MPIREKSEYKPLPDKDLVITTMRGTGPGGQHRNRTESCVRIVHKPTGLQTVVDKREQSESKREALKILTAKVHEHYQSQKDQNYNAQRKAQMANQGRGDKIRTYNFTRSHVVDHRTNKETKKIKDVIEKGRFDLIL